MGMRGMFFNDGIQRFLSQIVSSKIFYEPSGHGAGVYLWFM